MLALSLSQFDSLANANLRRYRDTHILTHSHSHTQRKDHATKWPSEEKKKKQNNNGKAFALISELIGNSVNFGKLSFATHYKHISRNKSSKSRKRILIHWFVHFEKTDSSEDQCTMITSFYLSYDYRSKTNQKYIKLSRIFFCYHFNYYVYYYGLLWIRLSASIVSFWFE